jgi:hypothetical protein
MTCRQVLAPVIAAAIPLFLFLVAIRGAAAEANPASATPTQSTSADAKDWAFDQGLYTNSPKTGQRVLQYHKGARAYRDPNSFFDSSHDDYPFMPSPYYSPYYLPYLHYVPYPYVDMPYGPGYGSYRYAP